jgi:hypothetical protein
MPAEVLAMEFLFCPVVEQDEDWCPTFDTYDTFIQTTVLKPLPFCYNAIHDIESAWWVGVWMMVFYKPKGHSETKQASLKRQYTANAFFPGTLTAYESRLHYFRYPNSFLTATTEWISEKFFPAVMIFDYVCALLLRDYKKIEETFPNGLSKPSDQCGPCDAFPGSGPPEDTYTSIKKQFLKKAPLPPTTTIP